MTQPSTHLKTPVSLLSKALLYVSGLLAAMLLLITMSLWLHNQQADRAQFLKQQQIPFIKNNAQLMQSVADLDRQLVAQQLAMGDQNLQQPLEDLKGAWEHIVALSEKQIEVSSNSLRDAHSQKIASQAQEFANGYKGFVNWVDDLLLMRQARSNQYNANMVALGELIYRVNQLRESSINALNRQPISVVNNQNGVSTDTLNTMLSHVNDGQFYQQIYQQLLQIENKLIELSNAKTSHQFNQISTEIAGLTRDINKQLANESDEQHKQLQTDVADITNQLMGSGQLFAKWREENAINNMVIEQLQQYQRFLSQTVELIEQPTFYALPEFSLTLPVFNTQVKESTMMSFTWSVIIGLLVFCGVIAWRLMVLVRYAYQSGGADIRAQLAAQQAIEKAQQNNKAEEQQRLNSILNEQTAKAAAKPEVKNETIAEIDLDNEETTPSFYKVNNLVMNLDKFNKYHGSTDMAVYMLDDYIERNNKNFAKLKEALAHENMAKVTQLNEAILKVANILSAPRLIKVCEQMQTVSQQHNMQQVVPLLVEMNAAIKEVGEFVAEV
ncbi:hypothetical protein QWY77_09590 [Thalassotalea ponticola]|uniref:hypothetical protein n=1 Tax=Thalassotalea ponticola TaxID=1523392 RepID=UPI0025B53727|nr:hypothetical protein [Thalassotalea ponticola]MDN3653010.1 hypothetical protein [Thalassotalea ponticola]